jgi:DNA-binding GntR family transcriptional regulator
MSTQAFSPIEHETLGDHAYARIRRAILSGLFEPGEKLTIRGLSEQLATSPTPIRESLRRLAAEHAVEIAPNRYIRIPLMNARQLSELRDIRTSLEGLATERAVPRMDPQTIMHLRKLDNLIRKLRTSANSKGASRTKVKAIVGTIQQFHFTIYRTSDMPSLVQLIESLWLRTAPYVNLLFPGYSQTERGNLRAMILTAIIRRDASSARRLMEADIGGALDYLIGLAAESHENKTRQ